MDEREVRGGRYTVRGKVEGDPLNDIVAAVAVADGEGGIACDARLTVPMLVVLRHRHDAPLKVVGGSFALDSETFVRGDGGMEIRSLSEALNAPAGVELILYTYPLLKALADDLASNYRWDL